MEALPVTPSEAGRELSEPAKELVRGIAGVAPVYSSFEFSVRLPDYLGRYWEKRQSIIARDGEGTLAQDYVDILKRAQQAIAAGGERDAGRGSPRDPVEASASDQEASVDASAEGADGTGALEPEAGAPDGGAAGETGMRDGAAGRSPENLLERFREIADELDGDKLPFFVPALRGPELRLLQAVHDLCLALIYYKLTVRVQEASDRLVMLTSSTGAQGCLEQSRNRFAGVEVPSAIHNFARLLELKLRLEEENCRGLLEG